MGKQIRGERLPIVTHVCFHDKYVVKMHFPFYSSTGVVPYYGEDCSFISVLYKRRDGIGNDSAVNLRSHFNAKPKCTNRYIQNGLHSLFVFIRCLDN